MAARNLYLRPVLKVKTYEPPELDMVSFVEIITNKPRDFV